MAKYRTPNVPFVEAHYMGTKQKPTLIVLRISATPATKGAALTIAKLWHRPNSPSDSCHYVVDEANTYRCVPDKIVSEPKDYGTKGAITVNICSEPKASYQGWDDPTSSKALSRTADLVAQLLLAYRIPVRVLDRDQEAKWKQWRSRRRGGIVLQIAGKFPDKQFLWDVQNRINTIKEGA